MTSISTINRVVKYGLRCGGSWPGTPGIIIRRLIWTILLSVLQVYQYSYIIAHYKFNTLIEIVDNLTICIPLTLVSMKLLIAWINHGILGDILKTMERECQKFATIDKENVISKAARVSNFLTSTVIYLGVSSTFCYAIGVFVSQDSNLKEYRNLLLKMDLPFDTSESPIYEIVVTFQYIYLSTSAFIFNLFTSLLLMIVLHVGCQVDVMCRTLTEVSQRRTKQLSFFVSRHQEIIIFTAKLEKLFTYITLGQLISSTLLTCCLGYLIVIEINVGKGYAVLMKCVVFYIAICLEAFIYCFAGEYLNNKSKLIGDTAYEFLWYNLNPDETRLLILVILRSQKGFAFTCGKFASFSMESFTSIMKASASYVSVLLAMS